MDPRADRTALRKTLYDKGFTPLANKRKVCHIIGWNKIEVSPELIEEWERKRAYMDTGVRCGDVLAVDLDIDDVELLDALAEAINASGIVIESSFVRIGRAPREMWIYRLADPQQPIGKRTTGAFVAAGAAPDADHVQVEILGKGNQFGAYGEHHEGVNYEWPEQNLLDYRFMDLPTLSREQAEQLIAFCAAFFTERGMTRRTLGGSNDGHYTRVYDLTPDMVFTVHDIGPMTVEELDAYLKANPDETLRCTVEALRPSTAGSMAGMVSSLDGVLCISDHGDQIAHFPAAIGDGGSARALGKLLLERFPQVFDEPTAYAEEDHQNDHQNDRSARLPELDVKKTFDDNLVIAHQRLAFVLAESKICDLDTPTNLRTPAEMKANLAQYYQMRRTPRGREQLTTLVDVWMQSPRRTNVQHSAMRPDQPRPFFSEDYKAYLNTWKPRDLPVHGDAAPGFDLIARLLPDERERAWFIQWLAYKMQNPAVRGPGVIMVAHDTFGTGRGSLGALITDMIGVDYTRNIDFSTLTGRNYQAQYNEWLSDSLFVIVSEAQASEPQGSEWRSRNSAYEHIKSVIDPGSTRLEVLRKGVTNTQGRTFATVLVFTNHGDAMVVPRNDRRLAILENGQTQTSEYWTAFHAWREVAANVGAFRAALMKVSVEGYNPYEAPMMTRAKGDMIDAGASDLDRAARAVIGRMTGSLLVKDQLVMAIERYSAEVSLDLPENWRDLTAYVFQRLTRKLEGDDLLLFPDGKKRTVRSVRSIAKADQGASLSESAMLEEVLKNGPLSRVIPVGGTVVEFARRS